MPICASRAFRNCSKCASLGGLSEVLRSDEAIAEMCQQRIRPAGMEGLDILPCGPKPPDPAELLTGSRFPDLLAWAETQYDQVLVDCPPVMAATDAAIVGRVVDGMLLVVQPEKNHRRLVLRAVESLMSCRPTSAASWPTAWGMKKRAATTATAPATDTVTDMDMARLRPGRRLGHG